MTRELIADFEKQFAGETAIQTEFHHQVDGFSITVLFGPSGCGKTTVLRCLAGLERPDSGTIKFGEETWFDHEDAVFLRPQKRKIGFLFQDYALFPHLRIAQNIGYGLRHLPLEERRKRIDEMLDLFDLNGLEDRYPHQVSGGQQQRIALARSVACCPQLLLLDEPLSALDTSLRERLRGELRRLLSEAGTPTVVVTHDRTEAIALADQVLVMHEGTVKQSGSPDQVFSRPENLTVAEIVGVETVAPAKIISEEKGLVQVDIQGRQLLAVAPDFTGSNTYVCIRAEDVTLQKGEPGSTSAQNRMNCVVTSLVHEGPLVRVTLDCGFMLMALITRPASEELSLQVGDQMKALVKVTAIHLLPRT